MPANLENSTVTTRLEKVSFHSNHRERECQKCSNYCKIALISHAQILKSSKVMLKFSKPGFSNMWTVNFQMFKLVLEKAKEPEIKLPTSAVINGWVILHCIYIPHLYPFLCQWTFRWLPCLVNSAAVNTGVHVSFWILFFSRHMPSRGIAGSQSVVKIF